MTAIAYALTALSLALGAAVIAFGVNWARSEKRGGDSRTIGEGLTWQLAAARTEVENERNRGDNEKRRADALDALIAEQIAAADPDGARDRLLARWGVARDVAQAATARGDSGPVPDESAASAADGRDALMVPGE